MRRIINGRKYDTETAKHICYLDATRQTNERELFRKKTGEFFIYEEVFCTGFGLDALGGRIEPINLEVAKILCEKYLSVASYERLFGPVEE